MINSKNPLNFEQAMFLLSHCEPDVGICEIVEKTLRDNGHTDRAYDFGKALTDLALEMNPDFDPDAVALYHEPEAHVKEHPEDYMPKIFAAIARLSDLNPDADAYLSQTAVMSDSVRLCLCYEPVTATRLCVFHNAHAALPACETKEIFGRILHEAGLMTDKGVYCMPSNPTTPAPPPPAPPG
ncbi:MAG: hypothetical protein L6Q57_07070 [Alphaproteobacteria bacterium]|nr:hypothetical protein [Alphaproteobacteria bacterium]